MINLLLQHLWLNKLKGTSCRKTWFWVTGMQTQNISKYGPKVEFGDSHILESSVLLLFLNVWKIWCENGVFMLVKMNSYYNKSTFCPYFPNKSLFSQNQLFTKLLWCHEWHCHILKTQCPISKFLQKIELKEQPI